MTIKQSTLTLVSFALCLAAVGCGTTRYGYRPAAVAVSNEAGFPASHYVVPAQSPAGEAFVTSFGTRDLGDGASGGKQLIHVRLAVSNQSADAVWSIDPGQLTLAASGGSPQRPDFMEIDGRQNGSTDIPRGQRKVLDLYYRIPGGASDARAVPAFDFAWQVNLGATTFAEHTPFQREPYMDYEDTSRRTVAVGAVVPWWWGWYGPPWWGPYGGWGYGYGPSYYGYGPRLGFGVGIGVHGGGYGPRYHGGGGGFHGSGRIAPTVRGRAH